MNGTYRRNGGRSHTEKPGLHEYRGFPVYNTKQTDRSSVRVELNVFAADTRKLAACLPATGAPPDGATAEIALPAFLPAPSQPARRASFACRSR